MGITTGVWSRIESDVFLEEEGEGEGGGDFETDGIICETLIHTYCL